MTQDKIAIDVVLLLPEEINQLCRKLNSFTDTKEYILMSEGYQPHITLGMGSLNVEDLRIFIQELESLKSEAKMLETSILGLKTGKYLYFEIDVNAQLRKLHTKVFDLIHEYSAGSVSLENFYEMPEYSTIVDWVNNFVHNSAYEKYNPHITLARNVEQTEVELKLPIQFKPAAIGLFHLGVHGTCKRLLYKADL